MASLNLNIDLAKVKDLPRRLKVVLGVLVVELVILLTGYLILDDVMADRVAQVDQLRANLNQLRRKNVQLRQDLERYPALRQRYDEAMERGIANPLDRAGVVNAARDWSDQHRLGDLRYRLMPDPAKPAASARYLVETDHVQFESTALLDTDALAFWGTILTQQPYHYRIAGFELERVHDVDGVVLDTLRRGGVAPLVKSKIDLIWTGIQPNLQGGS